MPTHQIRTREAAPKAKAVESPAAKDQEVQNNHMSENDEKSDDIMDSLRQNARIADTPDEDPRGRVKRVEAVDTGSEDIDDE